MGLIAGLIYGAIVALFLSLLIAPFLGLIGLIVFGILAGMLPFIDMWGPIKMSTYAKGMLFWLAILFGATATWYGLMAGKII